MCQTRAIPYNRWLQGQNKQPVYAHANNHFLNIENRVSANDECSRAKINLICTHMHVISLGLFLNTKSFFNFSGLTARSFNRITLFSRIVISRASSASEKSHQLPFHLLYVIASAHRASELLLPTILSQCSIPVSLSFILLKIMQSTTQFQRRF